MSSCLVQGLDLLGAQQRPARKAKPPADQPGRKHLYALWPVAKPPSEPGVAVNDDQRSYVHRSAELGRQRPVDPVSLAVRFADVGLFLPTDDDFRSVNLNESPWMMFGVDRKDPESANDQVIDIATAAKVHVMEYPPASGGELVEPATDLLFTFGADLPRPVPGPHAQEPREHAQYRVTDL